MYYEVIDILTEMYITLCRAYQLPFTGYPHSNTPTICGLKAAMLSIARILGIYLYY